MHRTEGLNYGTDSFGNNIFKETPLPPTTIDANWLNAMQEEVCNAIVASGQTLETEATDIAHTQLATAIARAQNVYSELVMSQLTFNSIWERTAANAYKVKDAITSLLIKPLAGGYFLTGATSPLSGGDTWGVFTLNKVMNMVCENESLIVFGNDNGKMVFPAVNGSFTNVILWRPTGAQALAEITGSASSFMPMRTSYGSPITLTQISVSIGGNISAYNDTAIGTGSNATGGSSNAIGNSDATGGGASTLGDGASASGDYSSSFGYGATTTEDNVIKLGNASATIKVTNAIVVDSDERDKTEIADNDAGLAVINKIKTKKYKMNPRSAYFTRDEKGKLIFGKDGCLEYDKTAHKAKEKAGKRWHRGVIAQDIAKDFDANEFAIVKDSQVNSPGSFDQMGVAYEEFIPIMIKAIQELSAKIEMLEKKSGK
jgi:hypothetical protein